MGAYFVKMFSSQTHAIMFIKAHENMYPLIWFGVGGCLIGLLLIISYTGTTLVSGLLLLLFSSYFARRSYVKIVAIRQPFLELTIIRLFGTTTKRLLLADVSVNYRLSGGMGSSKHHVLEISCQNKLIATLSPREGFRKQELERLAATLAN